MSLIAQLEEEGAAVVEEGAKQANEGPGLTSLLLPMMLALFVMMLLMRPKKADQQAKQRLAGLKKNDRVVTAGGIIGTVTSIRDDANYVTLKIDESTNAKMQIVKTSIIKVLGDEKEDEEKK